MKDTSGSAFPNETPVEFLQVEGKPETLQPIKWKFQGGLTKREWFAGMALSAMNFGYYPSGVEIAAFAYDCADAMIEAGKEKE